MSNIDNKQAVEDDHEQCFSSSSSDEESCQAHRQQQPFNYGDDIKVSRNAHDGKPVPLGGRKIPKGMIDDDWQTREPSVGIVEPLLDSSAYGEQYVQIENQRKKLNQIKKDLTVLHKYVAKYHDSKDSKDQTERNKVLQLLNDDMSEFRDTYWYSQYELVRDKASKDDITDDEMIVFAHDDIKKLSRMIFNYNNQLLQKMKAEKAKYATDKDTGAPSGGEGALLGELSASPQ